MYPIHRCFDTAANFFFENFRRFSCSVLKTNSPHQFDLMKKRSARVADGLDPIAELPAMCMLIAILEATTTETGRNY